MTDAVAHRGPDGEGVAHFRRASLGHRRLSIIDLQAGAQPMRTSDQTIGLVFNGEIFNYRELRAGLEAKGVRFRTRSDTEVVLLGYADEGIAFFDRLEGMFAGVLVDERSDEVVAFRDPFGIKPLYVCEDPSEWFFASEIRAIRVARPSSLTFDGSGLFSYLTCGYDPRGGTLFREIRKVVPGTALRVRSDGTATEDAFSSMRDPEAFLAKEDPRSLRDILQDALLRSTVSDVPIGLYLSGGVDSSLIAAILRRDGGLRPGAFCVSFPDYPSFDETKSAARVAAHLGIDLEVFQARPADFMDLETLVDALEEPLLDPSAFALGVLSRQASRHVKVVLSGEGGDELFGGYHRYFWHSRIGRFKRLPGPLRSFVLASLCRIPGWSDRARKLSGLLEDSPALRYFRMFSNWTPQETARFADRNFGSAREFDAFCEETFRSTGADREGSRLGWVDAVTFLREDLLVKADKMSMRHGLEVRVPFLQTDVMRAAFRNGVHSTRRTKPRLRAILSEYLPAEITERKKQGFEFPLDAWFRGPWRPWVDDYLSDRSVERRGWIPVEVVQNLREEHQSGRGNRGRALFSLCMLEAWMRRWLD